MIVYIPVHLRLNTTADKAKAARKIVERLLSSPMVRMLMQSNGVQYESIVVSDPVDEKGRPL